MEKKVGDGDNIQANQIGRTTRQSRREWRSDSRALLHNGQESSVMILREVRREHVGSLSRQASHRKEEARGIVWIFQSHFQSRDRAFGISKSRAME